MHDFERGFVDIGGPKCMDILVNCNLNDMPKLQNMLHANERHAAFCVLVSVFPLV